MPNLVYLQGRCGDPICEELKILQSSLVGLTAKITYDHSAAVLRYRNNFGDWS